MSDHLFREALNAAPEAFALHRIIRDPDGTFSDLEVVAQNPAAARMSGIPSEALVGKRVMVLFPSHHRIPIWDVYRQVANGGVPVQVETPYRGNGIDGWFETTVTRVGADHLAVFAKDVTARHNQDEEVRNSEAKYAGIISVAADALVTTDSEQKIIVFNEGAERVFGYSRGEVLGQPLAILLPERLRDVHARHLQSFGAGEAVARRMGSRRPLLGRRKNGEEFPAEASISHFKIDQHVLYSVALRDITERTRLEAELRLLDEISQALATSIDFDTTVHTILRFCVPALADFATLYVVDGGTNRRACLNADPLKQALTRQVFEERDPATHKDAMISQVLRTGKTLRNDFTAEDLTKWFSQMDYPDRANQLGTRSAVAVPLTATGAVFGVLTLAYADSGRRHTDQTVAFAEKVAHRAAAAIDNARLYDRAQRNDRRKDEFLATLAHELRNPLAPILASTQLLGLTGKSDPSVARAVAVIDRQVGQLVRLVGDLLDLSRIAHGKIELQVEPLDLTSAVRLAVETSSPLIETHGHTLSVTLPGKPLPISGDLVRLSQVISNLLNNAARYTPSGGRIELIARQENDLAVIRVRDNGVGVPREKLADIFEMFTQAGNGPERSQGGLGIGLNLARGLVDLHHGTIEACSEGLGKGSEFVVRLPLAQPEAGVGPVPPKPAASPEPAALRFLVVDDNHDAAEALAELLQALGNEATAAFDGLSALEKATASPPDVVLLDLGLPGMSGYEVARKMRQIPALAHAMLVAQTGWGQAEARRQTKEAGFDQHLVKPLSVEVIEKLVDGIKQGRRSAP